MASDDFAREMQQLAAQAERAVAAKQESAPPANPSLQPVILGLEALGRGVTESCRVLNKLSVDLTPVIAAATTPVDPAQDKTAKSVEWIHTHLHRQGQVESANQKLFDAMHAELKSYKDAFLFDALHKPFVKDLITLVDDMAHITAGVQARIDQAGDSELPFLRKLSANLENCGAHFDEIFARLDVESFETKPGAELDRQRHRTMSTEPAATEEEDGTVARSLRRGFLWRERVIRPEEVVARKWTPPKPPQIIEVEVGGNAPSEREKSPA
ncbi:MAG: nucleotide exchange factor GrpE [Verrucomicrobia bacterium]|nr:nucleotide exchange factor GrpE [Verrucomicrobiota bacterium]